MKKIYWIVLIVVIVLAGAWFYMMQTPAPTDTATVPGTTDTTSGTGTVKPGTTTSSDTTVLGNTYSQKGNTVCNYEYVSPSSRSSNVIYMSNGKVRGEFRTTAGSVTTSSVILYDGVNVYSWKEGMGTGTFKKLSAVASLSDILPVDLTSGAVYGTSANNASWDCHAWLPDPKILVRPTNMTFN